MKELAWSGAAVLAAVVCAALGNAVAWWRAARPFAHYSYELEPYVGPLTAEEEAAWAEIEARFKAEGAQ